MARCQEMRGHPTRAGRWARPCGTRQAVEWGTEKAALPIPGGRASNPEATTLHYQSTCDKGPLTGFPPAGASPVHHLELGPSDAPQRRILCSDRGVWWLQALLSQCSFELLFLPRFPCRNDLFLSSPLINTYTLFKVQLQSRLL